MKLGRRTFLQIAGATGTAALVSLPGRAQAATGVRVAGEDESSVLVDTTKCVGCRGCEAACAEANKLPDPPSDAEAFAARRTTGPECFTVVNKTERGDGTNHFVKRQCMHCVEPACVGVCPGGALTYGTRGRLIEEARRRVFGNPDKYVQHIYGEHEAGGTNWMYISDVPFEKLGFEVAVNDTSYPKLVKGALGVPPVVMTLWPPILMGLWAFSHRDGADAKKHDTDHGAGKADGGNHG